MMDVFFTESNPKPAQLDHEVDDFDPRAGEAGQPVQSSNVFGEFASNNNAGNGEDSFADFSSAFAGTGVASNGNTTASEDLFDGFASAPSTAVGVSTQPPAVDLFAGMSSMPAPVPSMPAPAASFPAPVAAAATAATSSMDLLGGLDFGSAPSLPPMGIVQPNSPVIGMGMQQPPVMGMPQQSMGAGGLGMSGQGMFGGMSGPSSLPLQPTTSALKPAAAVGVGTPAAMPSVGNGTPASANVGSTWQDLGKYFIFILSLEHILTSLRQQNRAVHLLKWKRPLFIPCPSVRS